MKVVFVCWGNICRSPMAERMAEGLAPEAGLADVEFSSAGVSDEEHGAPIDRRAAAVLDASGFRSAGHRAHRIAPSEIRDADLVVGLESRHVQMMRRLVPDADNLVLLTDFDPQATEAGIPDPWYGPASGFRETERAIAAALPGLFERLRELRRARRPVDVES